MLYSPKFKQTLMKGSPVLILMVLAFILFYLISLISLKNEQKVPMKQHKFSFHGTGLYTQDFICDPPILLECCRKKALWSSVFNPKHTL